MKSKFHVPFETAKALKEKGYNSLCICYYEPDKELYLGILVSNMDYEDCGNCSAPTYHEVVDWLEGKGIYVTTFWSLGESDKEDTYKIWWKGFMDIPLHEEQSTSVYHTREGALNEGILKALEML